MAGTAIGWAVTFALTLASGVEWPQFRGPNGDGHTAAVNLPTEWSEDQGIAWKSAIPGRGWSSPVIGDGLVWVTTAVEHTATSEELEAQKTKLRGNPMANQMTLVGSITLRAVAVDLDSGKIVHNIRLFEVKDPQPVHSLNSYASPSPLLVENRLVCHFGAFGTACVDTADGKILWKASLPNDHSVGPGSSPIVFEDLVIIPCDGTESQYVAALDLYTGKPVWKTARPP
ncbi:MAG: serine/threonine protein kinase, partial [Planctomycetales bacterium 12-60-4]